MTPSQKIVDFIKSFEGLRLSAYTPVPGDRPTIGYGATGPDIKLGMKWTQAQADARLKADVERFADGVEKAIGKAPTKQHQFDALVSFAFNCGLGNLNASTLLKLHKAGEYDAAASQFGRWDKAGGRVLAGLTRRRAAEAAIYRGTL